MTPLLLSAIIFINLALIFYSIGVISEARSKMLRPWHAIMFACGLAMDGTGTALMTIMSSQGERHLSDTASTLMSISGTAAIILMALHLIIALVLLYKKEESQLRNFHKISLTIWVVWLVSWILGPIGLMV